MTPEEMERLMQFILEHQAQFSVDMEKAKERMAESDERMTRIEGIQENTARQIGHLGSALVALTEAHELTQGSIRETQVSLRELAESQMHSDRRLDALIDVVRGRAEGGQSAGPEA